MLDRRSSHDLDPSVTRARDHLIEAVVAVARKLAVLMHVLWHRDVDFDPFYGVEEVLEASPKAA